MNNRPGSLRGMPVKGQQFSRKPINKKATLLRLLKYMMQFKWLLILALALTLFSNTFTLIGPRLSGSAIDCIAAPGGVDFGGVAHCGLSPQPFAHLLLRPDVPDQLSGVVAVFVSIVHPHGAYQPPRDAPDAARPV